MTYRNYRDFIGRAAGAVLIVALVGPAVTWAAVPGYDFVEGYYTVENELSSVNKLDGDGFGARASLSVTELVFVEGRYDEVESSNGTDSADTETWSLNAGVHSPVQIKGQALDFYGMIGYEELDLVEVVDGDGAAIELGTRWLPTERLEVSAFVRFADYGEVDNGGAGVEIDGRFHGIGVAYHMNPSFAVTGSYRTGDYELVSVGASDDIGRDDIRVGVRWHFAGPFTQ